MWPESTTALPSGTCLLHGAYSGDFCPTCTTAVRTPSHAGRPEPFVWPAPRNHPMQTGWECPKCGAVMAHWMPNCVRCTGKALNQEHDPASGSGS